MRIVISGTVGVGKSTTSKLLVKKLRAKYKDSNVNFLGEETVNSIYLDYYYKQPSEWAFIAQIDFLLGRFKQWLKDETLRLNNSNKKYITIYDRHFLDDYVFAELHTIKNNISNINSITYQAIYKELTEKMARLNSKPDFLFLLTGDLDNIKNRLKKRGRGEEIDVNDEYWQDLYKNYYERSMIQNHFKNNVKQIVKINTNGKKPEAVTEEIFKYIEKYNENNN